MRIDFKKLITRSAKAFDPTTKLAAYAINHGMIK